MRILISEDDPILAKSIANRLSKLNSTVDVANDGKIALQFLQSQEFDLVILDLNMPNLDGAGVLKTMREKGISTPVLVLTARDQLDEKVSLFNLGADDYLTKPFSFEELEVRCRALFRRSHGLADDKIVHGDLCVDRQSCQVTIHSEVIPLTHTEYRLLDLLLTHVGKVLSKNTILDHLYQLEDAPNPSAVEIYIARLRKSLSASQSFQLKTMRGLGYVLDKAK